MEAARRSQKPRSVTAPQAPRRTLPISAFSPSFRPLADRCSPCSCSSVGLERLTVDQEVGGSNPPSCTSKINNSRRRSALGEIPARAVFEFRLISRTRLLTAASPGLAGFLHSAAAAAAAAGATAERVARTDSVTTIVAQRPARPEFLCIAHRNRLRVLRGATDRPVAR